MSLNRKPTLSGEFVSEILGTGIFMFLGTSTVAGLIAAGVSFGQWEIGIMWGLSVAIAVYIAGGVSGAHINPAVTLALATFMNFEWRKVPVYISGQFIGAFLGALLTYLLYQPLISDLEAASGIIRGTASGLQTAGIFTTFANAHISYIHAMWVETAITAVLMTGILALGDNRNIAPKGALGALLVGLLVAVIGGATGPLTGFAMNPARDLAPRFMTFILGWGEPVMTGGRDGWYFWVPVIGPVLGAQIGAAVYSFLLSPQMSDAEPAPADEAAGIADTELSKAG